MTGNLSAKIYRLTVCSWTAENPRHDHQLIFPLNDGHLLLVWSEYYVRQPSLILRTPYDKVGGAQDNAPCRISGKVSRDKGRTWSERIILQENLWGSNVKHPNLLRLPSGEIIFTFTAWRSETQRNIFMKRSRDECETWSDPIQISEPGWYCINNDHILQLSNGRILLPAHGGPGVRFEKGNPLHSFIFYSDDDFCTWKMSEDTMTAPGRGAHEPSIVELRDGRLLCLLRTTQGCIYQAFSEDNGIHWSKPEPTHLDAPDSPPLVKRIPTTGDLLLLWNNVKSHSNWPRTPLTSAISMDDGKTWENIKDIDSRPDHDAAYAAITFVDDEALLTYYTRPTAWARDSEILLKIVPIEWFYR
jgi:sialidase-1